MKQVSSFEHNKEDIEAWEEQLGLLLLTVDRWHPEDEMAISNGRTLENPWNYTIDACDAEGHALNELPWMEGCGFPTKESALKAAKEALHAQFTAILETTEVLPVYSGAQQ